MRSKAIKELRALNRPVLITGHTGFKGTWLTLLLESYGIEVVGMSLEPDRDSLYSRLERTGQVEEYFVDIRDFEKVNLAITKVKPSIIFHMAAQPLVLASYVDPRGTFETNVMGTVNILESTSKLSDRCILVAVTTDKVYENLEMNERFRESDKLGGKDPYSASKVGTESAVTAWKKIWEIDNSHKICSVRAGNVIGGGDFAKDRLIPDIIRGLQHAGVVEIRNPKSSRPWQHVLDPLAGYVMTASKLLSGKDLKSVNFGPSEQSRSVREVVEIAENYFQKELKFEFTSEEASRMESKYLDLDSTYAHEVLGWTPKWRQEEAIHVTFSWWRDVLKGNLSAAEACALDISQFLENGANV